ncbi:MAG: sugar phosphate isomerase/epimerase [Candidatus Sericytochromatia bacterium]|nr:sugar phosphate isomerase/epimerase [Candidatus Sericytochromatia bacterium]
MSARLAFAVGQELPSAELTWFSPLRGLGFAALELTLTPATAWPSAEALAGCGVIAQGYTPGLTDGQGVAAAFNEVNPYLDALRELGCQLLVVGEPTTRGRGQVAGRVHDTGARGLLEAEWRNLADALNELGARCEERGYRLAFQPGAGTHVETATELKRLMNLTDPALVGLALDTGHWVVGGGHPREAIETYRWRLNLVRLRDVSVEVLDTVVRHGLDWQEAQRRRVFCRPGTGQAPLADTLAALREIGYEGWLSLASDGLTGPEEAPEFCRQALAGLL